jgi:hypothetical protein
MRPLDTLDQVALAVLAARAARSPIETDYAIKEAYRIADAFLIHRDALNARR